MDRNTVVGRGAARGLFDRAHWSCDLINPMACWLPTTARDWCWGFVERLI